MKILWALAACVLALVATTALGPAGFLVAAWVWVIWLVVNNRIERKAKERAE